MDKTGTITKETSWVQTILPAGTASEQEILQIAAACETASTHPIGISIVSAAKDQNLVIEKPAEIEEISGKDIHARLSQGEVLCENRKLLTEFNVDCGAYDENGAVTTVYISVNGKACRNDPDRRYDQAGGKGCHQVLKIHGDPLRYAHRRRRGSR